MSEAREQAGKIRLSAIAAEWSDTQTFNPRILAGEVACLLRTLPATQVLNEIFASAILYDPLAGAGGVTYGALVDYFDGVSQGAPPETITTSTGQVRAAVVFIARHWIDKAVSEATQRAEAVAGYVSVANDVASFAIMASGAPARLEAPAPPPSGSAPGYLQMRQAQQRQAGEKSAAEQLDGERAKVSRLGIELADSRSVVGAVTAEKKLLAEENELLRRELSAANLRNIAGATEFLDPQNPHSPPEIRLMFRAWWELSSGGTRDIATETGIGFGQHCKRWLERVQGSPTEAMIKRFTTALSPQSRKNGGVVAQQTIEKG